MSRHLSDTESQASSSMSRLISFTKRPFSGKKKEKKETSTLHTSEVATHSLLESFQEVVDESLHINWNNLNGVIMELNFILKYL